MSKRYSGKSFKDSSVMKKPKLSFKEKRKIKREKKKTNNLKGRSVSPENQIIPKYLGYLNTSLKTSLKV